MCLGSLASGIFIYLNMSSGVPKYIFLMSMPMNCAPSVLNTEFQIIFNVVRSAVLVVNFPVFLRSPPPAVIRTRLGSSFCRQKSMTNLQYVTTLLHGMLTILACVMTKMELVPLVPVLWSPCYIRSTSLPNPVCHTSLRSGSFANFLYCVIISPVTGCTTGAQKFSILTSYWAYFG